MTQVAREDIPRNVATPLLASAWQEASAKWMFEGVNESAVCVLLFAVFFLGELEFIF